MDLIIILIFSPEMHPSSVRIRNGVETRDREGERKPMHFGSLSLKWQLSNEGGRGCYFGFTPFSKYRILIDIHALALCTGLGTLVSCRNALAFHSVFSFVRTKLCLHGDNGCTEEYVTLEGWNRNFSCTNYTVASFKS